MRDELQMMRYTNWTLFTLLRSHLTYGAWDSSRLAPRINFAQVFAQPTFLIPASVKTTWEAKYDPNEGRPWKMPAANPHKVEKPWDPHRVKPADMNDLLKAVMKVPAAKQAQHELQWKIQMALDLAWHHNADLFPEPQGTGFKFPAKPGQAPAGQKYGSRPEQHLRKHAAEFFWDNPARSIVYMAGVGYAGYVAGMHFNPDIPQWSPEIPIAIPGTRYAVPGMTLKINTYVNDFRGTIRDPLSPQEFRATIQVDVNKLLRLFANEPSGPQAR